MEQDNEDGQDLQTLVQKGSARYSPNGREQEQILLERESVYGKSASEGEDAVSVASSDLHYNKLLTNVGQDAEEGQDLQTLVRKGSARYSQNGRKEEQIPLTKRESVSGKSASEGEDTASTASSDYLHHENLKRPEIAPDNSDDGQINSGGSGDVQIPLSSSGYPPYPHDHDIAELCDKNLVKFPPVIYTKDNSGDKNPVFIFRQASQQKESNVPSNEKERERTVTMDHPHPVADVPKSGLTKQQSFINSKMIDQISDKYSSEDCNTSRSQSGCSSGSDYVSGLEADGASTHENQHNGIIHKMKQPAEASDAITDSSYLRQNSTRSQPSTSSSSDENGYAPGHMHVGPVISLIGEGECQENEEDGLAWDSSDDDADDGQYNPAKQDLTQFDGPDFLEPNDDDD